jgi:hypothetical protein
MSNFFTSSDKIQVGQTDVSIPAENGLNYNPGGKIDLYVPPTSKFVDLSQSRLQMKVKLSLPTITADSGALRLQLDDKLGLHSLIRSIRIFTGRKTALLEEIEGYDILTALRFDYETNDNIKKKRALTEGATAYDPASRGTLGTTKTDLGNCFSNPYFSKLTNATQTASFTREEANDFQEVKAELHLNTGLFRNEAVFPALLTDGIFIEILLQEKKKLFRKLDSVNEFRRLRLNPVFHSVNGSDADRATTGSFVNGGTTDEFFITRDNNQTSVATCPFVVGQKIALKALDGNNASVTGVQTIEQIEQVTGGTVGTSKTKISLVGNITNNLGYDLGGPPLGTAVVVDATTGTAPTYEPNLVISDVNLIVKQIQVPDGYEQSMMSMMNEGGTINYDYRSFTNYRYSQLSGDNVANVRLPLIESRAMSILCIPTDATNYSTKEFLECENTYNEDNAPNDTVNNSARSGLVGISDNLQEYQFIYDGKINPSRKVDVSKISAKNSISQQWCIESEKALAMSDIEPLSFLQFRSNFFIGRALALGKNAVYDARGKDFNLQLEYTGAAQTKNKLWNNFVSHLRRLVIRNGSIEVQV